MELYKEILVNILKKQEAKITFEGKPIDVTEIVESTCYGALQRIKKVLEDDSLDDVACFNKIEEIVCVFEDMGSSCGSRHDFG